MKILSSSKRVTSTTWAKITLSTKLVAVVKMLKEKLQKAFKKQ